MDVVASDQQRKTPMSENPAAEQTFCERCDTSFATKASLRRHVRRTHDSGYLRQVKQMHASCPYCGVHFANPHARGGHIAMCSQRSDAAIIRKRLSASHAGSTHPEDVKRRIRASMQDAVRQNPDSYAADNVCGRVRRIPIVDSFGEETTVHGKWKW